MFAPLCEHECGYLACPPGVCLLTFPHEKTRLSICYSPPLGVNGRVSADIPPRMGMCATIVHVGVEHVFECVEEIQVCLYTPKWR